MSRYVRYALGDSAATYVHDRLSRGRTLARALLKAKDIQNGTITTVLPEDVIREADVYAFSDSILPPHPASTNLHIASPHATNYTMVPVPNLDDQLAVIVKAYLEIQSETCCIFEDEYAHPDDEGLRRDQTQIRTYDDDVYHILTPDRSHIDVIRRTIAAPASMTLIGALTLAPPSMSQSSHASRGTVSLSDLTYMAARVEHIIVGAYDREGFLIWSEHAAAVEQLNCYGSVNDEG